MHAVHRTPTRCPVCGLAEVRIDEVVDHGVVLLAECPRCEHRWTSSIAAPQVARPVALLARTAEEPATAA